MDAILYKDTYCIPLYILAGCKPGAHWRKRISQCVVRLERAIGERGPES